MYKSCNHEVKKNANTIKYKEIIEYRSLTTWGYQIKRSKEIRIKREKDREEASGKRSAQDKERKN